MPAPITTFSGECRTATEFVTLLSLPDDLILRIYAHILPCSRSIRLSCPTHASQLSSAASLSLTCNRLRALWTCAPALSSVTACVSCGDRPWLTDAVGLLRAGVRVRTLRFGQLGWARCNYVRESLCAVGEYGRWLTAIDLSHVEFPRPAGVASLGALLHKLAAHGFLETLALWAGNDHVFDAIVSSQIVAHTRLHSLTLREAPLKPSAEALNALEVLLADRIVPSSSVACGASKSSNIARGITHFELHCRPAHQTGNGGQEVPVGFPNIQADDGPEEDEDVGGIELDTHDADGAVAEELRPGWSTALRTPAFLARVTSLTLQFPGTADSVSYCSSSVLSALSEVCLREASGISGKSMCALVAAAPELERVSLRDCRIAGGELLSIATALGSKLVEFVGCIVFTETSEIDTLRELCPNVERLGIACNDPDHVFVDMFPEQQQEHAEVQNAIREQAWGDAVVALCEASAGKLIELDIETTFLSDHAVQKAVAAAPLLEELTVRWAAAPDGRHDFWMLRGKAQLRTLAMLPSTRNMQAGMLWQWSATSIVNVSWYCRQFCRRLEQFRLSIPTLPPGRDSSRVWRALDRLQSKAPLICTTLARSRLYHPYGKQSVEDINPLDANWGVAMQG
jgi:hypothetical protein